MGSYSLLSIDRVAFAWKYDVPTFLTFLFRDEDFYTAVPEDPENTEESRGWLGYRTTVKDARKRLDELGFTCEFLAGIFERLLCGDTTCYRR